MMRSVTRWAILLLALAACHRVFGIDPDPTEVPDAAVLVPCCVPDQDCGAQTQELTCLARECTWSTTALCTGTHAACATYLAQGACETHMGCGWTPGSCDGTHVECTAFGTIDDCDVHGCTPESICSGDPNACGFYSGNQTLCEARGCIYDGGIGTCKGVQYECSHYRNDPTECAAAGCTPSLSTCKGTAHGCEAHATELDCTMAGCGWKPETCAGTPEEACASFVEATCGNHEGCGWSPSGGCAASTTCSERDLSDCAGNGCLLELCAP